MSQEKPHQSGQVIDAICDRFEASWLRGEQPVLEDYVEGSDDHAGRLLTELVALDLAYRRNRGEQPRASEYRKRFPRAALAIDDVFRSESTMGPGKQAAAVTETYIPGPSSGVNARNCDPSPDANAPSEMPDSQFGDYQLVEEIARGGMGVVYKALQTKANRIVALKMILSGQLADDESVQRFHNEAEAAALLDHPNIVPVFDVGEVDGQHFFSMGYVEGASLSARLREGPLEPRAAAEIVQTITMSIAYAHGKGVIHRDLKPANILLDAEGDPRVTDFGLAKRMAAQQELTTTGQIMGTPGYMPPEQAMGDPRDVDARSDVYSLGAVLYCALTGRPPFQAAHPIETIGLVINEPPVPPRTLNPAIDPDLETICLKCLEKQTGRRYQTANELSDELTRYLSGQPIHARPVSKREQLWRLCKRRPLESSLVVAFAASLLIGTTVSIYFAVLAGDRAEQAERGSHMALTTLETVINTVQNKLRGVPGAQEIRRELLRDSLASLQEVSRELRTRRRVDRNTAVSLVELGRLFVDLGDDDGLNAVATAESNFREAVNIFRQLVDKDESDLQILTDYAWVLSETGNFFLNGNRPQFAEEYLREALAVRRKLEQADPHNANTVFQLCFSLCDWGDLLASQNKREEALPYFEEAIDRNRPAVDTFPDNHQLKVQLARCYEKMGDVCHDLGKNDEAYEYFQLDLKVTQASNASLPGEFFPEQLSFCYERLGNHWLQVREPQKALRMYEHMRAYTEKTLSLNPSNRIHQEGVSVAWEKIAAAQSSLGNSELAQQAREKARFIRSELARTGQ